MAICLHCRAIETVGANGLRTGSVYTPDGKVLYTGPLAAGAPDGGHAVTVDGSVTPQAYTTADFTSYTEADPVQYDNALGLFYTASVDPDGNATRTYADAQGRTVRTAYADGSFAETLYSVGTTAASADAEGDAVPTPDGWPGITRGGYEVVNVAQRKLGDAPVYTYDLYDAAGRLSDVWQAAVADGASTDPTPVNPHWQYTYDTAGNETAQVSGAGNTAYANPAEFTTSWVYDPNGNKVGQTLPDGELQTWAYDVHGNNTSHKVYSAADPTTALQTTLDTYDTSAAHGGRLVEEDRYASDQGAGTSVTPNERTTYTYDDSATLPLAERTGRGNVAEVDDYTLAGGSLQETDFTHYTYDPISGSQATITTADGTIHYVYDEATGNLVETWTGANPSAPQSAAQNDVRYGYDAQGRLGSVTQVVLNGSTPPSVNGTRYDADGNPVATTQPTTVYTYDNAGNLKADAEPNGDTTAYTYNALNQVTLEVVTDANTGHPVFQEQTTWLDDGQKAGVVDTRGDGAGHVTSQTTTAWTYDADARLTNETLTVQSGSGPSVPTPYSDTFAYDLDNNRTAETVNGGAGQPGGFTVAYAYNGDDQLQTETGTGATAYMTQYGYDANGSLLTQVRTGDGATTSTYEYDLLNRMTSIRSGNHIQHYYYDFRGNVIAETVDGASVYFLNDPNSPTVYLQYLAVVRLSIAQTVGQHASLEPSAAIHSILNTLWDSNAYISVIQESSTIGGTPFVSYVVGLRVEAQAESGNAIAYLIIDGHGSTRSLSDSSGNVVTQYDYSAFGDALDFNPQAAGTVQLFGGAGRYDPASHLTYHVSRWTNGFWFTQADSFAGINKFPASQNHYDYAAENPVIAVDPGGHVALGAVEDTIGNLESADAATFALAAAIGNGGSNAQIQSLTSLASVGLPSAFSQSPTLATMSPQDHTLVTEFSVAAGAVTFVTGALLDALVGASSLGLVAGLASNPVGWAIGTAVVFYISLSLINHFLIGDKI